LAEPRPLRVDDYFRFRILGEPAISPDGTRVAFTVQTCDPDKDENRSAIWLATVAGTVAATVAGAVAGAAASGAQAPAAGPEAAAVRQLTSGTSRDRAPTWSPDGTLIAFISDRADGRAQIHVLPADGGEARRVETDEDVQGGLAWSPDGRTLAFVARVWSKPEGWTPYPGAPEGDAERARARALSRRGPGSATAADASKSAPAPPEPSDVKVITRLLWRMDGIGEYGDRRTHVFTVPADGSAKATRVTDGDFDHAAPAFSPDGRLLAVAANRRPGEQADLANHTDLWVFELASGRATLVLQGAGPVMNPRWSPDGRHIAFVGHDGHAGRKTSAACWVVAWNGPDAPARSFADARNLSHTLDRPVGYAGSSDLRQVTAAELAWSADSRRVYFPVSREGNTVIYSADLEGEVRPATPAPGPNGRTLAGFSLSPATGRLAYIAGDAVTPDEVYALDPAGGGETRLSALNVPLLAELHLQPVHRFRYEGADGMPVDGWFIPALGVPAGQPAPCVLSIHGGPHGMYGNALQFGLQLYAAHGLAVLFTNPRGSEGYGQAFVDAVAGDWGGKDYVDIQKGLDHAIAQGWVDPARCGVTGWSYGGFMTAWTITQTSRFKAAIAGAIVSNRLSFYGTSDIGVHFGETEFPGAPWENEDGHLARSALRFAARVSTPVLFLHGEADLRCPVPQTEEFFTALRRQGKTAVMVRYPGEFHGLQKPRHKADRMRRSLAWFRHHL
jgi:dipeptidyl aminopeptidase/acylaminoacyl peptidase